jgi:hypothetical protein
LCRSMKSFADTEVLRATTCWRDLSSYHCYMGSSLSRLSVCTGLLSYFQSLCYPRTVSRCLILVWLPHAVEENIRAATNFHSVVPIQMLRLGFWRVGTAWCLRTRTAGRRWTRSTGRRRAWTTWRWIVRCRRLMIVGSVRVWTVGVI